MSTYKKRIEQGLCGKCGKKPETPGAKLCDHHRELERQRAAEKREANKLAGTCINCGKPTTSGKKCETCKAAAKKSRQKAIEANKQAGICVASGCHNEAKPGCTLCQDCIDYRTDVSMKHYQRRKEAGTCLYCDNPVAPGRAAVCETCYQKKYEYRRNLKFAAMDAYGGRVCAGCGFDDAEVLEIDHVDGNGAAHRRELNCSAGHQFYQWLKKQNFPPGFRVLCPTCNKKAHRNLPLPSETEVST